MIQTHEVTLPSHPSSQNPALSLTPIFHCKAFWNHPASSPSPHTLNKSRYHQDWIFLQPDSNPYLETNMSFHFPCSLHTNRHFHFASKALLNLLASLIPNPSSSIGLQTFSQLTQEITLFSLPHAHMKLL